MYWNEYFDRFAKPPNTNYSPKEFTLSCLNEENKQKLALIKNQLKISKELGDKMTEEQKQEFQEL